MSFTQLNPTIPMTCPKGRGYALAVIDYSQDHDLVWCIALDNGEIWCVPNAMVRMQPNWSLGRTVSQGG
jgi:hypothetical protein